MQPEDMSADDGRAKWLHLKSGMFVPYWPTARRVEPPLRVRLPGEGAHLGLLRSKPRRKLPRHDLRASVRAAERAANERKLEADRRRLEFQLSLDGALDAPDAVAPRKQVHVPPRPVPPPAPRSLTLQTEAEMAELWRLRRLELEEAAAMGAPDPLQRSGIRAVVGRWARLRNAASELLLQWRLWWRL